MRVMGKLVVATVVACGVVVAGPPAAGAQIVPGAVSNVSDPPADVANLAADIIGASLAVTSDGLIVATLTVAQQSDPLVDPDWVLGASNSSWYFDIDSDDLWEYRAVVYHDGVELRAEVLDVSEQLVCESDPFLAASKVAGATPGYSMVIDPICIDDPVSVQWYADTLDGLDAATADYDVVPDGDAWVGPFRLPGGVSDPNRMAAVQPARLLDTRPTLETVDGQFAGGGTVAAGGVVELRVAGRGGVARSADAVMLNVTAVTPGADGFITVWPCNVSRPLASHVNYRAGSVVPNAVLAKLDVEGDVCIYTSASADLIVDVNGFAPFGAPPEPLVPARVADSRPAPDGSTVDGIWVGFGMRSPGSVTEVLVAGRANVPVTAAAVMLNVTAIGERAAGYLAVFPCGGDVPATSSVNFRAGQVVANAVFSQVGANRSVCVFASSGADFIVDVNGYVPAGGTLVAVPPARFLESRPEVGPRGTFDGQANGFGLIGQRSFAGVAFAGRGAVPAGASAVMLNVTAINTSGDGFITVWPCGSPRPLASHVNTRNGQVVPNAVLAKIGDGGQVCFYSTNATHLAVDVTGYVS